MRCIFLRHHQVLPLFRIYGLVLDRSSLADRFRVSRVMKVEKALILLKGFIQSVLIPHAHGGSVPFF